MKKNPFSIALRSIFGLSMVVAASAYAAEAKKEPNLEQVKQTISAGIQAAKPGLTVTSVETSVIPGLYKTQVGDGPVVYATADGKYFIAGEVYELSPGKIVNLTDQERNVERAKLIAGVNKKDAIVFSPKGNVKKVMYVFTDVDCGYCRMLHSKVAEYNDLGIEIRYLAYPRAGIPSKSYNKIASAWCSKNRNEAITKLKNLEEIPENVCAENPVAAQFDLGRKIGLSGTPALVFEDGQLIGGYVEPARLAEMVGI
ncbi:DsbC family protein [Saccharophagus sp. K07]|jgi:thiol:disulfide interchange protein DsbC|uniref:DsbC family protein n=1 Tax=Saccharophagus sp. K07 TaxID=2283636 RepID=UPI00165266B2|nr:DsbC family protein [Saccharophagus sp. K07]MBC6903866.1 DsbC family protein [Saccharophagus sp. K07]